MKKEKMELVIIESPFFNKNARIQELNINYARECMKECLYNGEAPYLSHLLYTQILDDNITEERNFGIEAGFTFRQVIKKTIVYTDLGISSGMKCGIENALENGNIVEHRKLKNFNEFMSENILLNDEEITILLYNSNITEETSNHDIEIIFNKLFGNVNYDCFMTLQEKDFINIKNKVIKLGVK